MAENVKILPINPDIVFDRLKLCWGHLDDWRQLKIVQKSKEWLEKTNAIFTPTTLIAYKGGAPAGMIEFIPQKLMKTLGLCPCRVYPKNGETEDRYILGKEHENHLFISCLSVDKDSQGKGIGRALLNHLLSSQMFKDSDGACVYVRERDEKWDSYIHWPAGPKEFYLRARFVVEKTLVNPTGHLLCYRKKR